MDQNIVPSYLNNCSHKEFLFNLIGRACCIAAAENLPLSHLMRCCVDAWEVMGKLGLKNYEQLLQEQVLEEMEQMLSELEPLKAKIFAEHFGPQPGG